SELLIHHRRRIGQNRRLGRTLKGLQKKIIEDIRRSGRLQRRCDVRKIEEAQNIIFDVHSRGIKTERKVSAQCSELPVLLDLRQHWTDAVGVAGGVAIVELVLTQQEPT